MVSPARTSPRRRSRSISGTVSIRLAGRNVLIDASCGRHDVTDRASLGAAWRCAWSLEPAHDRFGANPKIGTNHALRPSVRPDLVGGNSAGHDWSPPRTRLRASTPSPARRSVCARRVGYDARAPWVAPHRRFRCASCPRYSRWRRIAVPGANTAAHSVTCDPSSCRSWERWMREAPRSPTGSVQLSRLFLGATGDQNMEVRGCR